MESFIRELRDRENKSIIRTMAFMSYNPSIGRVLEKRGVKKFERIALNLIKELSRINKASPNKSLARKLIAPANKNR